MSELNNQQIRVRASPSCYACGSDGIGLYKGLRDKLFGATGQWDMSKCPKCGLVWLNPMPIEEDIGKAYQAYYTHHNDQSYISPLTHKWFYRRAQKAYVSKKYGYKREPLSWLDYILFWLISVHPGRRVDAAFKVFYLPAKLGGKLLEVGCGHGAMLRSMQEMGWQVEGVDFDPNAVHVAKERGLNVQLGGLKDQHYPSESFDAVVMSHVIEHVPDPRDLLRECYRILKVGGRLIVVTPNAASWGHRLYGTDWRGLEPPRHLHIFSRHSLEAVAVQAGFVGAECRSTVRGARGMFLACMGLKRIKEADTQSTFTVFDKLKVEMMEVVEEMLLLKDDEIGEELTLTCIKRGMIDESLQHTPTEYDVVISHKESYWDCTPAKT